MGLGAVVVGIAVLALLVWAAVIVNSRRVRPTREEEPPANLSPFLTDDEMESRRVSKVLVYALVASAVLALVIPIYYLSEADRQVEAAEDYEERDIEEGVHWFEDVFLCADCHGAEGVGGGATFIEHRSGLETTWAAPSINDVFYRYSEDEVRFWLEFGRAGTPMPAMGLEGGGSGTSQEIDQVIAYLRSVEIPQEEAFAEADNLVDIALQRLDTAAETVAAALADQEAKVERIRRFVPVYAALEDLPLELEAVLAGDDTCTSETAALVDRPCDDDATDSDRDGIGDSAEQRVSGLLADFAVTAEDVLPAEDLARFSAIYDAIAAEQDLLDPANAFSTTDSAGEPVADLELLDQLVTDLDITFITLRVTAANNDVFVANEQAGADFLAESLSARRWEVDMDDVATQAFDGDVEAARRGVGLFNAYCARCHTAGYSAGVAFEHEPGSGAWGPSLLGGKSVRQFPDAEDHFNFIVRGSDQAQTYGVNGFGNGFMPAFGAILSEADIRAIVAYERSM